MSTWIWLLSSFIILSSRFCRFWSECMQVTDESVVSGIRGTVYVTISIYVRIEGV